MYLKSVLWLVILTALSFFEQGILFGTVIAYVV